MMERQKKLNNILIYLKFGYPLNSNHFCYINFIRTLMRAPFSQKLDSDHIRKGLLNIRNTQLELLNQLKHQTEMLKHYSPPSTTSEYSQRVHFEPKRPDRFSILNFETKESAIQQVNKLHQSDQQLNFLNQKELKDEINYLKNQNKLANNNYQKLKKSTQIDKDKISELQLTLKFISKLYYDIILQIFEDKDINDIKKFISSQFSNHLNQKISIRLYIDDIMLILTEQQKKKDEKLKIKSKEQSQKEIASQLIDLKSQLSLLITQSNQNSTNANQIEISKLKEELEIKDNKIEQLETNLKKIEVENRQISRFWDKELSQRKKAMNQLEKLKKQAKDWEQKQKKIIFYAKDMEARALKAEKTLKDKQKTEQIMKQTSNKLTQTLSFVRQNNETLRLEVKSLQQSKQKKYATLIQQKKQLENELRSYKIQQQKLIQSKDAELMALRNHIGQMRKNQQSIQHFQRKSKENQMMQQDIYWRKVNIIRTNSTIDHLWQVKEVEYENLTEIIAKMKK